MHAQMSPLMRCALDDATRPIGRPVPWGVLGEDRGTCGRLLHLHRHVTELLETIAHPAIT